MRKVFASRLRAAFFAAAVSVAAVPLAGCFENPVPALVNPAIPAVGPAQEAERVAAVFDILDAVLGAGGGFREAAAMPMRALQAERLAGRKDGGTDSLLYAQAALAGAPYLRAYAERWGLAYGDGDLTKVLLDALGRGVRDALLVEAARARVAAVQ